MPLKSKTSGLLPPRHERPPDRVTPLLARALKHDVIGHQPQGKAARGAGGLKERAHLGLGEAIVAHAAGPQAGGEALRRERAVVEVVEAGTDAGHVEAGQRRVGGALVGAEQVADEGAALLGGEALRGSAADAHGDGCRTWRRALAL